MNGIKIAVGHVIIHLAFFISMFEIDQDININLNEGKTHSEDYHHRFLGGSSYTSEIEIIDPLEVK